MGDRVCAPHHDVRKILGLVGLFSKLVPNNESAILGCLVASEHSGFSNAGEISSTPFDGNLGMYWVGWELGLEGVLRPVSEFGNSVARLDALTIPVPAFAEFNRDLKKGFLKTTIKIWILTWMVQGATFCTVVEAEM